MATPPRQGTAGPWQTLFQTFVVEVADEDDTVHGTVQTVLGTMDCSIALLRNRVNLSLKTPDVIHSTDSAILASPTKLIRLGQLLDDAEVPVGDRLAQPGARTNRTSTHTHPHQHARRPRAASTLAPPAIQRGNVRAANAERRGEREKEGEDKRGCCQHHQATAPTPATTKHVWRPTPTLPDCGRSQTAACQRALATRQPAQHDGTRGGWRGRRLRRNGSRAATRPNARTAKTPRARPRTKERRGKPCGTGAPGSPAKLRPPSLHMQKATLEPRSIPARKMPSKAQARQPARVHLACLQAGGARETPVPGARRASLGSNARARAPTPTQRILLLGGNAGGAQAPVPGPQWLGANFWPAVGLQGPKTGAQRGPPTRKSLCAGRGQTRRRAAAGGALARVPHLRQGGTRRGASPTVRARAQPAATQPRRNCARAPPHTRRGQLRRSVRNQHQKTQVPAACLIGATGRRNRLFLRDV